MCVVPGCVCQPMCVLRVYATLSSCFSSSSSSTTTTIDLVVYPTFHRIKLLSNCASIVFLSFDDCCMHCNTTLVFSSNSFLATASSFDSFCSWWVAEEHASILLASPNTTVMSFNTATNEFKLRSVSREVGSVFNDNSNASSLH